MTNVNGFSTTTKTTIGTTGSDIAQCIQKLNDENQRLRDALRTTLVDIEGVCTALIAHRRMSRAPRSEGVVYACDHIISRVHEHLAALTPEGASR